MTIWIASLAFGILLGLDLGLVATRAAYQQVSQARLLNLRESKEKGATRALTLLPHALRMRAGLNLALILVRLLIAWTVIDLFLEVSDTSPWWSILILLLVGLVLFWCEWGLERKVSRSPETWAANLAWFGRTVMILFSWPTAWIFALEGEAQKIPDAGSMVTEEDLHSLVDAGQEDGVFEQGESRMIFSIVRLGETLAREIMVPRLDVVSLDVSATPGEAAELMLKSGHSRMPVYEGTIDQVLGILYVKDLLRAYHNAGDAPNQADPPAGQTDDPAFDLRGLLRSAYFIPEAKRLDVLMAEMQEQRIHMAVVVDEYGGVAGLVTLEDIVEEIVGEIQDEYDQGEESPVQTFEDGSYVFLGRVDLDDFNEIMGSDLSKDDADTIGGYIYSRLGKVPTIGETVTHGSLLLKVEQVSARRIRKVRASWLSEDAPGVASQLVEKGNIDDRSG
jgi:putative hemolysin